MFTGLSRLFLAALALSGAVSASPSNDEQVNSFLAREGAAVRPLNLGRRSAATTPTRHLRPEFYEDNLPVRRRDTITPPDVGQVADFGGKDPEPIRNGAGDTFLATSNHEIDAQNPDNVAAPPTDQGKSFALASSFALSKATSRQVRFRI